jgi:uncharacterized protein YjdB
MIELHRTAQHRILHAPRGRAWLVAVFSLACGGSITATDLRAPDVAEVVVAPLTANVVVGSTLPLQATIRDASGQAITGPTVLWSVQDTAIATVSPAGVVSARAVGSTQVAASANGRSGLASITVIPVPVASVSVTPARVDLAPGAKATLDAVTYDASGSPLGGRAVVWASSNGAVATVDASGVVTALAAGAATITATSEGISGSSAVSVVNPAVASVAIEPGSATLRRGATLQLSSTITNESGAAVTDRLPTWTSSNPAVAIVSASGLVTALSTGSANIAAALDGKADTASITVVAVPVGSVSVQPTALSLTIGQGATLTATVKDANGAVVTDRPVAWTTGNSAVASVTQAGVVKALAAGTATISATSEGSSGSAVVTVAPAAVDHIIITPGSVDNLRVGHSTQLSATAVDANGNAIAGATFTWQSSSTWIATVNSSGKVTGVHSGTVTISATFSGRTGSASVRVR